MVPQQTAQICWRSAGHPRRARLVPQRGQTTAAHYTFSPVFAELGDKFVGFVDVLSDVSERMTSIQVNPAGSTSEEFANMLAADLARWSAVAKAANIRLNE